MRSPPLVPDVDQDVYLVLEDFGKLGRAWREAREHETDRKTVVRWLREGQFNEPVRVVCFNTANGTARDVTAEIAREINDRADLDGQELPMPVRKFIEVVTRSR